MSRASVHTFARIVGLVVGGLAFALAGCMSNPLRQVEVAQPLTARPPSTAAAATPNYGSIYRTASYQPLFEDHRARNVGDILTISINENINASKTASSTANRAGSMDFAMPDAQLGSWHVKGGSLQADSKNDFSGKGDSAANNVFTGSITVTVIDVLPNGNLIVAGEKQIGINQGSEFIRLSGVVNPLYILAGNVISSTQVADARLEYRGTGYIDEAQTMGWLSRVFMSVMPF